MRQALAAEDTDVDDDRVSQFVERFDGSRWLGRRSARVVGMARRRTFDGWAYQVSISPWSDRLAHKICKRCAGYDVMIMGTRVGMALEVRDCDARRLYGKGIGVGVIDADAGVTPTG